MLLERLSILTDWNPQLRRELKGRLTRRNVLATGVISFGAQTVLVRLCLNKYQFTTGMEQDGDVDIFNTLTWVGILLLLVLGSYLLVRDLRREARRGTLEFLQLTPESGNRILWGKVLGVPSLLYVAIALSWPLHLWSALGAGQPAWVLLAVYLLAGSAIAFLYSFTVLYALSWRANAQVWYVVVLAIALYGATAAVWMLWALFVQFGDPTLFITTGTLILACIGAGTWNFWHLSIKRFHNPPQAGFAPPTLADMENLNRHR